MRPLLIALRFLTRLPLPSAAAVDERDVGRSMLWYPLVGILIGLALVALNGLLAGTPTDLRAALLLAAWVLVTGALHLDGLADSADAWAGGLGDKEKTLAIMKDPCCGPVGVTLLVVVLIVKFAALESIAAKGGWTALVLAPLLGRAVLPLLFLTTPYVRVGGLGEVLAKHLPQRGAAIVVLVTALAVPAFTGKLGLLSLGATAMVFLLLRSMMLRRIQGTTGDTAGATVELTETAILAVIAAM